MAKPKKLKKVAVELIPSGDRSRHPLYKLLDAILKAHHEHLRKAKIALAWNKAWRADVDGRLVLGKCKKATDLDRELAEHDFVILLNQEAWEQLTEPQRLALFDHQLSHCQQVRDEAGRQKEDERGRLVWRIRKHDVEDFRDVIARNGCYTADLADFVRTAVEAKQTPLFPRVAQEA